ncbi:MAG: hypothetical protein GX409_03435, partial [candidate division Zixibacteria bacterium]|nr:hypothetical protein [candidate division Zixibacteria bacterium]
MIGKTRLLTTLRSVISKSAAQQTEVVFIGSYSGTSRFANSTIHQNVAENNTHIYFRSVIDGKIGVASTTSLSKDNLLRAMKNSLAIAERALPNPDFKGLPKPVAYKKINTYFEATAAYTPKQRAEVIRDMGRKADKLGLTIAGAFTTSSSEIAVLNSNGIACYQPLTTASLNLIAMSDSSSGYAEGLSRSVLKIPFALITETAFKKCLEGKNPESLEPAKY